MVELDIVTVFLSDYLLTDCNPKSLGLSRIIITTSFICPQKFSFLAAKDDKASSWLNKIKGVGIYCLSFYKS